MGLGDWLGKELKSYGNWWHGFGVSLVDTTVQRGKDIGTVAGGVGKAYNWTVDKTGTAMGHVYHDPEGTAAMAVKEGALFANYAIHNPERVAMKWQEGLLRAGGSTVGMIGDLGVGVGYNTIIRGVSTPFANAFGYDVFDKVEGSNCAGYLEDKVEFKNWVPEVVEFTGYDHVLERIGLHQMASSLTDPEYFEDRNGYEKGIKFGAQAVGEVGAFIGLSAVTGGTAGFATGLGRGAAMTRSASWGQKATQFALPLKTGANGLKISPFASTAELGGAGASFGLNYAEDLASQPVVKTAAEIEAERQAGENAAIDYLLRDSDNLFEDVEREMDAEEAGRDLTADAPIAQYDVSATRKIYSGSIRWNGGNSTEAFNRESGVIPVLRGPIEGGLLTKRFETASRWPQDPEARMAAQPTQEAALTLNN